MPKFHVTYEIITPESAVHCDAAERGFMDAAANHIELAPSVCGEAAGAIKDQNGLRLSEAVELLGCVQDGGNGFDYYETDGRQNYRTGDEERRAFHLPDNTTAASSHRVARLLKARRLLLRWA